MSKIVSFSLILIILQIISTSQLNIKSFDIFTPNHIPFIEGHRGVNKEFPENTLRSFKSALDNGIDGIELDVWLSKDNVPVVVHGSLMGFLLFHYKMAFGFVRNYYLHELKKLEVRKGNDKMPTLEEVFQLCKGKLFINIEIKDGRCDKIFPIIIDLIKKYDMFEQISISSFNHKYAKYVQEFNQNNDKKIEFGFLYGKKIIFDRFKYDMENTTLNMYYSDVTKERCDKAHKNGMAVIAWFRMNDRENEEKYKKLLDDGVDCIITNYPKEATKFRDYYVKNKSTNNQKDENELAEYSKVNEDML
jgi:glycerophosphoryl diester phosphodiesterase